MPSHEQSAEAAWLAGHYSHLADYRGRDLRGRWVAVLGEEIVDDDTDPGALAVRVTQRYGEGAALFASVVAGRLG